MLCISISHSGYSSIASVLLNQFFNQLKSFSNLEFQIEEMFLYSWGLTSQKSFFSLMAWSEQLKQLTSTRTWEFIYISQNQSSIHLHKFLIFFILVVAHFLLQMGIDLGIVVLVTKWVFFFQGWADSGTFWTRHRRIIFMLFSDLPFSSFRWAVYQAWL